MAPSRRCPTHQWSASSLSNVHSSFLERPDRCFYSTVGDDPASDGSPHRLSVGASSTCARKMPPPSKPIRYQCLGWNDTNSQSTGVSAAKSDVVLGLLGGAASAAASRFPSLARLGLYETQQVSHLGRFNLVLQSLWHQ